MEEYEIILTAESRKNHFNEEEEGITDAIVKFPSGESFTASFISFQKISELRTENKRGHKFLDGLYFWTKDMILIETCSLNSIQKVIENLIEEGDFHFAFRKISEAQS